MKNTSVSTATALLLSSRDSGVTGHPAAHVLLRHRLLRIECLQYAASSYRQRRSRRHHEGICVRNRFRIPCRSVVWDCSWPITSKLEGISAGTFQWWGNDDDTRYEWFHPANLRFCLFSCNIRIYGKYGGKHSECQYRRLAPGGTQIRYGRRNKGGFTGWILKE